MSNKAILIITSMLIIFVILSGCAKETNSGVLEEGTAQTIEPETEDLIFLNKLSLEIKDLKLTGVSNDNDAFFEEGDLSLKIKNVGPKQIKTSWLYAVGISMRPPSPKVISEEGYLETEKFGAVAPFGMNDFPHTPEILLPGDEVEVKIHGLLPLYGDLEYTVQYKSGFPVEVITAIEFSHICYDLTYDYESECIKFCEEKGEPGKFAISNTPTSTLSVECEWADWRNPGSSKCVSGKICFSLWGDNLGFTFPSKIVKIE